MKRRYWTSPAYSIILAISMVLTTSCSIAKSTETSTKPTADPQSSPTEVVRDGTRTILSYDDLMEGFDGLSPVDDAALTLPAGNAHSEHTFEGRLELHDEDVIGGMTVLRGDPDQESEVTHLPEFDFEFVQSVDGYLIPVQRGLIIADHPCWNYILGPGR